MKREYVLSPGSLHMAMKLYFNAKERPAKSQPLQPGIFFYLNLMEEVRLMKVMGRERLAMKCRNWELSWISELLK